PTPAPPAVPAPPATAAPVAVPMAVEVPAPAVPAAVRLKIDSDPAGAQVTDARKGTVLGTTPFEKRVERDPSPLELRLAKGGFQGASLSVPRDRDFETSVHLDRVKRAIKREPRAAAAPASSPAAAKPVAHAAAAPPPPAPPARRPAAAKPVAPAAAAPPPPPPKPRAVEKW